ncbi:MAG TPA: sigma-54 dependent transcriptional regulator [Thermoanaerobaculia bacterium]|jgi:DNA-binding NtrC family response regulator|nr:sigma-54 dependent transcriptional regulator [Thermoanaerobaculia bacterium]
MPHALAVDDDPNFLLALAELIESQGFTVNTATTLRDARQRLARQMPDIVLVDLYLPDGNGIELLKDFDPVRPTQVVLMTGHADLESAVQALRLGASDYMTKPLDIGRLKSILGQVANLRADEQPAAAEFPPVEVGRFGLLIGESSAMQEVYALLSRVAPTDATVFVIGESGTGKDLAAQTLHMLSARSRGPFLPLNCGAISPNLIESELFGHERGSFTGAQRRHQGYFERAHGGTLFLDEIAEMPIELQVKLLRVLETGQLTRVGGDQPTEVDVRVITATNRDPATAVAQGKLREDLLYRLQVFPVTMPPLSERGEDVERLAEHFLAELNQRSGTAKIYSADALDRLRGHSWPGNVRELKNVIHRAFILADGEIEPKHLPHALAPDAVPARALHFEVGASIEEVERRLIIATLDLHGGNKRKTADVLGVSLKTLYNRLNAYRMA